MIAGGKLVDYGADAGRINLGEIPLSAGSDRSPVYNTAQAFNGEKTLDNLATSPNSGDDLGAMPDRECVTFQQLTGFVGELKGGYIREIESAVTDAERELIDDMIYIIRDNGQMVGVIDTNGSSSTSTDTITQTPEQSKTRKFGKIKVTGTMVLPAGVTFIGLRADDDGTVWAVYYYYV